MKTIRIRLFGREIAAIDVDDTPDEDDPPSPAAEIGGGGGHNFDRRGEIDFDGAAFGFQAPTIGEAG